ncbi:MAG: chorismate-binding protein [Acidimicrobiia bacterium]
MKPIWVDGQGILAGSGPALSLDPGSGDGRYHEALEALRSSGRPLAFASFTFDVDEHGSILEIPETVQHGFADASLTGSISASVVDDGVDEWRVGFEKAKLEIETGRVEKVVLARQVLLEMDAEPDAALLTRRLARANPECFVFSVGGLVGASPELLVSLRNGRVSTLALAGTATDPNGLETAKILEEHRHVAKSVTDGLHRHIAHVDVTEQVIVPHGVMSHVGTRIAGPANPGTTVADILADLHPTAAVAGSPTPAAIDLIREIEPTSRGRYAGPVGWIDPDGDGVFAIALRCGQIEGRQIKLYSGGGLVAGSEAQAELDETELKLAPMLTALGQS